MADEMHRPEPSRTLFDPDFRGHDARFREHELPFWWAVQSLGRRDDERFEEQELCTFDDVQALENNLAYGSGSYLSGPLTVHVTGNRPQDLRTRREPFGLPEWVEADGLRFLDCAAEGIVVVDRLIMPWRPQWLVAWRKLNLILFVSNGLPRQQARRALHRLATEKELPVYVLTDCDTWGYFMFSLLKRGILDPSAECSYLAVPEAKFIGLRAGDFPEHSTLMKPWKSHWSLRVAAMKQYACFKGRKWQRELRAFEKQQAALELWPLLKKMRPARFIEDYLLPKIARRAWLS